MVKPWLKQLPILFCFSCAPSFGFDAQDEIYSMSLEDLLNVKVTTASGVEESLVNAPAAMVIVTANDFRRRGYQSLVDVLADLPGFDNIETGGHTHLNYYQRGYRTPTSTRTLFMVNGIVDNHLWSQESSISRQYPMSSILRVEVLYGPASVHYGPNAFSGIINVITKNAKDAVEGANEVSVRGELGSWNSKAAELAIRGKKNGFGYSVSTRWFSSDEEDLSDRWGFLENRHYNNADIWGPIRDITNDGMKLDHYADETDDVGLIADFSYQDWQFGGLYWKIDEGYGTTFAGDRGQANGDWRKSSHQYYIRHDKKINDNIQLKSFALYRESHIWGNWSEAEPDWRTGMQNYAFVSHTNWRTTSDAYELKQDLSYDLNEEYKVLVGWRYKYSDVTKSHDVPGYWSGNYSSTTPVTELGPHGFGAGIFHSTDPVYSFSAYPKSEVPDENRETFQDQGLYVSTIYQSQQWGFNLGVRYDDNSIWGSELSPRLAATYKLDNNKTVFKAVYGEAFQEPPAQQLYGGWSGRRANANLQPEKMKNIEFILMHQTDNWLHDASLYFAKYKNVIRESAINDAERDIWGVEYRGQFEYPNFIENMGNISGNFYYTWTKAKTSLTYDHQQAAWVDNDDRLGDIAPHKINMSVFVPVTERIGVNLKGNFYSRTSLYSRNPLAAQGIKLGSKVIFDAALSYQFEQIQLNAKIENVFDREVMAPGIRNADSGNDFSQRSKGYANSLTPLPGRSFWLTIQYQY